MKKIKKAASVFVVAALFVFAHGAEAKPSERFALVIGNSDYSTSPLPTATNDAGLIAQTLSTAGFDVTGAANLDQESIRRAFRDFIDKVKAAGPHAISFIYLSGYGLQYAGENYFVPVDASLQRDTDVPVEALRLSDFTHALEGLPLDARVFVLDAARANPFPTKGSPLAGGLALVDVEEGSLYAFNAAPGTIAPAEPGPYGAYAQALAEMLRYGGIPLDEVFARTRLRANELTHGALVPWDASKLTHPIILLAKNPDAASLPPTQDFAALRSRAIRDYPSPGEAYAAAVELDTLSAYQEFLSAYPKDPLARRVRALLAARREALTWNRTIYTNKPDAYWSYMRRYPKGPHFYDARRRLAVLSAPLEPPPRFDAYDFQGLPPPPDDEYEYVDRPYVDFGGRDYPPPPPPPEDFLPPAPREFRHLPPPEEHEGYLPAPAPLPLPFAHPAPEPGRLNQPDLRQHGPESRPGGQPPAGQMGQPPAGETGRPGSSQAIPQNGGPSPHPGQPGSPNHSLPGAPQQPAAPQSSGAPQPPAAQPQRGPAESPRVHPEGSAPQGHPGGTPPAAASPAQPQSPAPQAQPNHPTHQGGGPVREEAPAHQGAPATTHGPESEQQRTSHPQPEAEPTHAAPQAAPRPTEHPAEARPTRAAPPAAESPRAAPTPQPHAEPPYQAPAAAPASPVAPPTPHAASPAEAPRPIPSAPPHAEPARPAPQAAPHVEPGHPEAHAPGQGTPHGEAPKDPQHQQHPPKPGEPPAEQR